MSRDGAEGWLSSLLALAGVQPRPFRGLLAALLLRDLRSSHYGRATATKPNDGVSPLVFVVGQYLLLSGIVAGVLYARVDAFFFALVNLAVSMGMVASSVVVEWSEVALDPKDEEVFAYHPLSARTFGAARLINLAAYVLLLTVALNLFPAVLGLGLYDGGVVFVARYLLAALLGDFMAVGIVLLVFLGIVRTQPAGGAREVLSWTQIILLMVAFYGGQSVLRDSHALEMVAYNLPAWISYTPCAWLASWVAPRFEPVLLGETRLMLAVVAATATSWVVVLRELGRAHERVAPAGSERRSAKVPASRVPGRLGGVLTAWIARTPVQRATFWLCTTLLRRDPDLRSRIWPSLGLPLTALLVGVATGRLGDPVADPAHATALSLAAIYLTIYPVIDTSHSLRYSANAEASWILFASPIGRTHRDLLEGQRKMILWVLMAPLVLVLGATFLVTWHSLVHAIVHIAIAGMVVLGTSYVAEIWTLPAIPFSSSPRRGTYLNLSLLNAALANGAATVLAVGHYYAARSLPTLLLFALGMAVVVGILRRHAQTSFHATGRGQVLP
jgi:hypothetical protein